MGSRPRKLAIDEVLADLELRAPVGTAESWDNVGLLVGDARWETSGAVVSIDLTEDAIASATRKGYRLIVTHHPCIFPKNRGITRVSGAILKAAQAGIAVAACHTNFDRSALEVSKSICDGLDIVPQGRLLENPSESLVKLVVFVPSNSPKHLEQVRAALVEAGAGHIGNYDFCTFGAEGEGTFRGGKETKPFLGHPGELERAREIRLETVFPKGLEKPILRALRSSHPYEEIAYDLYPVKQAPPAVGMAKGLGYGFWGQLRTPKPFSEVARDVTSLFNVDGFLLTEPSAGTGRGRTKRAIKKVAFVAGKGASFVNHAASLGCDLFITGETGYHTALEGSRRGMTVMELGHRESERFFILTMKRWLSGLGLKVIGLDLPTQKIGLGRKTGRAVHGR